MLPSSGVISLLDVRTELSGSGAVTLNDANVRTLAAKPSGIISLADLYGKSAINKPTTGNITVGAHYTFEYNDNLDLYGYNLTISNNLYPNFGSITPSPLYHPGGWQLVSYHTRYAGFYFDDTRIIFRNTSGGTAPGGSVTVVVNGVSRTIARSSSDADLWLGGIQIAVFPQSTGAQWAMSIS